MSEETQPELLRKLADLKEKRGNAQDTFDEATATAIETSSTLKGIDKEMAEIWAQLKLPKRRILKPKQASTPEKPKGKVSKTVKLRKETSNSDKHKGLDQLKEEANAEATCPEERGG